MTDQEELHELVYAMRKVAEAWWDLADRVEARDKTAAMRAMGLLAVAQQAVECLCGKRPSGGGSNATGSASSA